MLLPRLPVRPLGRKACFGMSRGGLPSTGMKRKPGRKPHVSPPKGTLRSGAALYNEPDDCGLEARGPAGFNLRWLL